MKHVYGAWIGPNNPEHVLKPGLNHQFYTWVPFSRMYVMMREDGHLIEHRALQTGKNVYKSIVIAETVAD